MSEIELLRQLTRCRLERDTLLAICGGTGMAALERISLLSDKEIDRMLSLPQVDPRVEAKL